MRKPAPATDSIDLRMLLATFRRRLGLFIAVVLGCAAVGLVATALQTPLYTATAEVTLNARPPAITPTNETDRSQLQGAPTDEYIETQVAVITSEANLKGVAARLNIAGDPRFQVRRPGLLERLFGTGRADKPKTASDAQAALDYLSNRVMVERVIKTYGISISFSDPDPAIAKQVADAFAEQYTAGGLDARRASDRAANLALAGRLDDLRQRSLDDSVAVQRYRLANNLLNTTDHSLTEQEISSYNQAVTAARAQAAEDEARLATARSQLRTGSHVDDLGESLNSPVISSLRLQQSQLASQLASLQARYGSRHPDVVKARAELDAANRQIEAEISRLISNLDAKSRVSQQRLASLTSSLNGSRGELARNNAAMVGLQDLEKRAETSNALYQSYLNRYKELSAREGIEQSEAGILHRANLPTRTSSPNYLLNAILALSLGIGLGIVVAFVAEMSFSGLTIGDDIEQRLGVRYLGTIPDLKSVSKGSAEPIDAVVSETRSAFAESFRSLRASISFATHNPKVIAIASALPGEGKTTLAICLARSMAMTGDKILLIDGDLRRQGASKALAPDARTPGLMEVLRGSAKVEEAILVDPATKLCILPARDDHEAAELLAGEEMGRLLDDLRRQFDAIIIDTAPVLPIADARLVLEKADASVFVVRWRTTPEAALRSALRLLPADRVEFAGVALSRVNMRQQASFGYGEDALYKTYKSYYA
jgi:capsular exopolysaccharide synthesis family protein